MGEKNILEIIEKIHRICSKEMRGPNCVDRNLCDGACCRTSPDIPATLAWKLVQSGLASESDFIPSDFLPFRLKISGDTGRCTLFESKTNGCSIHFTPYKPPQCWIYPLQMELNEPHVCKKGFKFVVSQQSLANILELLEEYKNLAEDDTKDYKSEQSIHKRVIKDLPPALENICVSTLFGIKSLVIGFEILISPGINFLWANICEKIECGNEYSSCNQVCREVQEIICSIVVRELRKSAKAPLYLKNVIFHHDILDEILLP